MSQGKRHNQALIALARRRCDVLFAMMRDGTFYTPQASLIGAPEQSLNGRASSGKITGIIS